MIDEDTLRRCRLTLDSMGCLLSTFLGCQGDCHSWCANLASSFACEKRGVFFHHFQQLLNKNIKGCSNWTDFRYLNLDGSEVKRYWSISGLMLSMTWSLTLSHRVGFHISNLCSSEQTWTPFQLTKKPHLWCWRWLRAITAWLSFLSKPELISMLLTKTAIRLCTLLSLKRRRMKLKLTQSLPLW